MKPYTRKLLKIIEDGVQLPSEFSLSSPSKISKRSGSAFSLPAGKEFGCIGETEACRNDCYAKGGRHVFSSVQNLLARNWTLIKHFESTSDSDGAVAALLRAIPESAPIFRIHESSDFFSQWYVNVWEQVARARPNTSFWFYTRSFSLDFSGFADLQNVTCWASTDSCNVADALKFVDANKHFRHAYGPLDHEDRPEDTVICPVTSGKLDVLGGCEKCGLCVHKGKMKKNIGFLRH